MALKLAWNCLYSATPYPASAAKTIKDVNVSIDVALFAKEGKLIEIYDVPANSKKNYNTKKELMYNKNNLLNNWFIVE